MNTFDLLIVTYGKVIYQGKALSLVVPAGLGSMGVLCGHMPLISTVSKGILSVTPPNYEGKINFPSKGGGFLQIKQNKVTVILDGE
jgi:F-type H+-transporting ATPase subunit epsilon